MKNNTNRLILSAFFIFVSLLVSAQPGGSGNGPGSGGGSTGPGAQEPPSSPIDMYVYALSIVAVLFIVFFTNKYKSQKI